MSITDKRVLVTGGSGFLGSYVLERLKAHGFTDVVAPRSREFDLRVMGDVQRLFGKLRPQIVIHLAARVGGIGANQREPGSFFYDNAMMGLQLMEQARLHDTEKFVAIGTICAYPKHTPVPFREENLWDGFPEETNAPYGLAKKMMLVQGTAYRQQYGFKSVYLLPVNLFGPRDNFDPESSHVIPALIRKCVEAKEAGLREISLWGDGSPTREFLYAEDAAEGIVLATEKYDGQEPVNLGSGQEIAVADLAQVVAQLTGYTGVFKWDRTRPNGQPRRCLDVSRAQTSFGFKAKQSLRAGLEKTVAWFLVNRPGNVAKDQSAITSR